VGETGPVIAQPAPVGAPPTRPKLPGLVGIWIGVALVVLGLVVGVALFAMGLSTLLSGFDDMQRVPIATGGSIRVDDVGEQSVFAERPTYGSGSSYSSTSFGGYRPPIEVRVTGPNGNEIPVVPRQGDRTYTWGSREGTRIGVFDAPVEGRYELRAVAGDGASAYTALAVGDEFDASGVVGIVGGIFGGGALVIVGIVVIVISAIRRSRARRAAAQPMGPAGPYATAVPLAGWGTPGGYPSPTAPGAWQPPPGSWQQPPPGSWQQPPGSWPPAPGTGPQPPAAGWAPPPVPHPDAPAPPPEPVDDPPTGPVT